METLLNLGYVGLFIGSLLAATILPFSSDVLVVGMLVAKADIVTTVVVATLGNWLGGVVSYYMGYLGKWEWIEKYLKVKRTTLEKQKSRIDKYGSTLAFFSWLPFVGDLFAIALGFYRANPFRSILFMLIGKAARFIMWALLYTYAREWLPGLS